MSHGNVTMIMVDINDTNIKWVILERGSGVNVITKDLVLELGLTWEPPPFTLGWQTTIHSFQRGIVKTIRMKVAKIFFDVNMMLITMKNNCNTYNMLLGRSWLRVDKVKHNWHKDGISVRKAKKNVYIEFVANKATREEKVVPLCAKTCNMIEGLDEDEEENLLKQNPNLNSLFRV